MPKLNPGNYIHSFANTYNEWEEPYARVQHRRYLAYARLTNAPQSQIPLMVPSRDRSRPDTQLSIGAETIYSVRAWRGIGTTMSALGNIKMANALADAGFVLGTASAGGLITANYQLNGIGLPGSTLTAPLGANATPNLPLSLFATAATTTVAAAVGLAIAPTPVDAVDTYQRATYSGDRLNQIVVEVLTFNLDLGAAMTVNGFAYELISQNLTKGM